MLTIAGAAATGSVPAAGHLLARMLSDDVPVRLRLLVTQATAENATSGSLHEFSDALAYFERPNPEGILSALYARAAIAPAARRQDAESAGPVAQQPAPQATSPDFLSQKHRRAVKVAAALLLLAVTGLFVSVGLRNGRLASMVERLESVITTPAEATIGEGNNEATKEADPVRTPATSAVIAKGPHRSTARALAASDVKLPLVFEFEPPTVMVQPELEEVLPPNEPDLNKATFSDSKDKVYSRSDARVTPPRQVYAALPAQHSPRKPAHALTVIDLVVAADGQVEHARLRTEPRDVHEFMLVSAAKAWRFDPATVDGRPVRFRLSVAITSAD
jgi:hypothetical protein